MEKMKVLFLCTGNSARSQMAEAFTRRFAGDMIEAHSAGLEPRGLHPLTVQVMEELGIDMRAHTSKPLSQYLGKIHFGYLITVCAQADANCPAVFPGMGQRLHWEFEDPAAFQGSAAESLQRFREIRDQIRAKVSAWIEELGLPLAKI